MLDRILKPIDDILNVITMYRLMLYYLIFLWGAALFFSFLNKFPFSPLQLIISTTIIVLVSWITNTLFAKFLKAITNLESVYITALILILIITPFRNFSELPFLIIAPILAMVSKYLFSINKKHIFNPVAISVFIPSIISLGAASWWIGTSIMLPFVLIGGLLVVRKIRRYDLVFFFTVFAVSVISIFSILNGFDVFQIILRTFVDSPIIFFAFVMLTEPLTTPPTKKLQIIYAGIIALIFYPLFHIGPISSTPEMALLIGNIYSYLISPKGKLILTLK